MPILLAAACCLAVAPAVALAQPAGRDVFVTVLDADGAPVTGMTPEHFAVREDGRDREVLGVTVLAEPMHIALLIDTSGGVGDGLPALQAAASAFVDAVGPGHRMAIYSFGERAERVSRFVREPAFLKAAINRLFTNANLPRLIDAVEMAAKDLAAAGAVVPVIVAVTTTGTEVSATTAGKAIKALVAGGTSFHAVAIKALSGTAATTARGEAGFTQSRERMIQLQSQGEGDRELTQLLQQGTAQTGGHLERVSSLEGAGPALTRVVSRLRNAYKLSYASTTAVGRRPKNLQVGVMLEGVTVLARVPPTPPVSTIRYGVPYNARMRFVAGIDVGGTAVNYTLLDEQGTFLIEGLLEHPALAREGPDVCVRQIHDGLAIALARVGASIDDVVAVGLDTPGPASATGVLSAEGSTNFEHPQWAGFDLRGAVERALGLPVSYLNDGNAAALWGHVVLFGDAAERSTSVSVVIGTGLGGGIVMGGRW